jgi:NifU-like protein involved in Fe-S cluster formation
MRMNTARAERGLETAARAPDIDIMTAEAAPGPYSNAVLALAADIPHLGDLPGAAGRARKVSRICGSEVEVALDLDAQGRVSALGLDVSACALGQASASVFARGAIGADRDDLAAGLDALTAMLKEDAVPPQGRFAALEALAGARDYPLRHGSILLAFQAGLAAYDQAAA